MNDENDSFDSKYKNNFKSCVMKDYFVLIINMVFIHNYDKNSYQFVFFQKNSWKMYVTRIQMQFHNVNGPIIMLFES